MADVPAVPDAVAAGKYAQHDTPAFHWCLTLLMCWLQVEREVEAEEALVADELDDASMFLGRFVESLTGLFRAAK